MRFMEMAAELYGGAPTIAAGEAKILGMMQGTDGGFVEGWDFASIGEGLEDDSREWKYAWGRLLELTADLDVFAEDEESGECWEYLGSGCFEGRWVHSFRHRHHPILGRRWNLNVPVTREWLHSVVF